MVKCLASERTAQGYIRVCGKSPMYSGEDSLYDGLSGLALAVEAAEGLHLLSDSDPSGLPSSALIRALGPALRGGFVKQLLLSVAGIAALVASTAAFAAPNATTRARLVSVTSPVSPGAHATLVARVVPTRRCTITVYYMSGPSHAQGLYAKRPVNGRVSWTWMVGTNTTAGRWPIQVRCGTAGSFRTSFRVS
jgi:hypothetical protein